ncbi:unnamed protein product [Caenorhabditis auriculariae]|uniref:Uncharacterized protein n=1 Tax=Caenorhabditis auriculariae TaxID=2777116 RepID=A0A8S1GS13_9PELO|nr:unnamed protein product [Caenorhabditis auriculariae]
MNEELFVGVDDVIQVLPEKKMSLIYIEMGTPRCLGGLKEALSASDVNLRFPHKTSFISTRSSNNFTPFSHLFPKECRTILTTTAATEVTVEDMAEATVTEDLMETVLTYLHLCLTDHLRMAAIIIIIITIIPFPTSLIISLILSRTAIMEDTTITIITDIINQRLVIKSRICL